MNGIAYNIKTRNEWFNLKLGWKQRKLNSHIAGIVVLVFGMGILRAYFQLMGHE